jgi:hypothetical protein
MKENTDLLGRGRRLKFCVGEARQKYRQTDIEKE